MKKQCNSAKTVGRDNISTLDFFANDLSFYFVLYYIHMNMSVFFMFITNKERQLIIQYDLSSV